MEKIKYSQNNEQQVIEAYFGEQIGAFLDLGSNNGIILSNVYNLVLNGWKGYSVEASAKAFEQLQGNYKHFDVELFNMAITADKEGEIIFYESGTHLNQGDVSLLSTTHQSELKKWEGSSNTFEESKAIAVPFEKFYESIGKPQIDFISSDIEGNDIQVLHKMNLTEMGVKAICIEHNSIPEAKAAIITYCSSHHMNNILLDNAENLIISR